jgi:hypothetical protein
MDREAVLLKWAAECDVLMNLATDPKDKQIYKRLRDTWIALAHQCPNLSYEIMDADFSTVEEVQSIFDQGRNGSIH